MTMAITQITRKLWLTLAVMFVLESHGCYTKYEVPFYGDITAYEASFTDTEKYLLNSNNNFVPDTCVPIHISAVIRHAIRFPDDKDIEKMKSGVEKIRWKITNETYADLNNTAVSFPDYESKQLTATGRKETRNLAKRIAQRYEHLLKDAQLNEKMFFWSSTKRTKDTGISFQDGLTETFGNQSQDIIERKDLLKFHKNCPKHDKLFEDGNSLLELDNYIKGTELATLLQNVNTRLLSENDTSLETGTETFI